MTRFINGANQIPIWWVANQWNRHTCTVGDGTWRYNWHIPAARRKCLLKREPATFLQNSVPTDQKTLSVKKPQFCSTTSWPLQYSFCILLFPSYPFLYCTWINWCMCTSILHFFKLNGQWYVLLNIKWIWDRENYWFCENTPFSPLVACSSALIFVLQ